MITLTKIKKFFEELEDIKPIKIGSETINNPKKTANSFIYILESKGKEGCYISYYNKLIRIYEETKNLR